MHNPLHFVADDREVGRGVVEALQQRNDIELEVARLTVGDYRVGRTLLVERKTIPDLGWSVRDGRVFGQAHRLLRAGSARACLFLEGEGADFSRAPIPRSSFEGALITLGVVYGLPVIRSRSPEHTADLLVRAASQACRSCPAPPLRRSSRSSSLRRLQSLLLQTIPDIGPRKAAALLETFGTPAAIAAATRDELGAVRGLGKTLSRRLWWVLHERASPGGRPIR